MSLNFHLLEESGWTIWQCCGGIGGWLLYQYLPRLTERWVVGSKNVFIGNVSYSPVCSHLKSTHPTTAALSPSHHIHHPHPSPDTSLFSPKSSSSSATEDLNNLSSFNSISAKLWFWCYFLWIFFILWLFYVLVAFGEKSRVIWRFSGWHRALHLMSGNLWLWMRQSRGGERAETSFDNYHQQLQCTADLCCCCCNTL